MTARRALLVALFLFSACTEHDTSHAPPHRAQQSGRPAKGARPPIVDPQQIAQARERAHAPPPAPEPREPRVFSVSGAAHRIDGHVAVAARDLLPSGQWFETATDGKIVFDFPQDGRVEILANTRFAIGENRPMQVLLASGAVHAVLVPIGNAPRAPMRIATASSTTEITGSGDIVVRTSPDGADTTTTVMLGEISVHTGTREANGRQAVTRVHAGQRYLTGIHHRTELAEGMTGLPQGELEPAPQAAQALVAPRRAGRICASSPDLTRLVSANAAALNEALTVAESALTQQRSLDTEQRAASRTDQPSAMRMMRDIAAQAQRVSRNRQQVLVLWEDASAYRGCAADEWARVFGPLAERARAIVGTD